MIENTINNNDLFDSLKKTSLNSLNFENSSTMEKYENKELNIYTTTNLHKIDSYFINKYYDRLKKNAIKTTIPEEKLNDYYRNPKLLSYDLFQSIDYWYLILILNGWNCAFDMMDLNREILIPDANDVAEILIMEEFYSKEKED